MNYSNIVLQLSKLPESSNELLPIRILSQRRNMSHQVNNLDINSVRNTNKLLPFDSPKQNVSHRINKIYNSFRNSDDKSSFLSIYHQSSLQKMHNSPEIKLKYSNQKMVDKSTQFKNDDLSSSQNEVVSKRFHSQFRAKELTQNTTQNTSDLAQERQIIYNLQMRKKLKKLILQIDEEENNCFSAQFRFIPQKNYPNQFNSRFRFPKLKLISKDSPARQTSIPSIGIYDSDSKVMNKIVKKKVAYHHDRKQRFIEQKRCRKGQSIVEQKDLQQTIMSSNVDPATYRYNQMIKEIEKESAEQHEQFFEANEYMYLQQPQIHKIGNVNQQIKDLYMKSNINLDNLKEELQKIRLKKQNRY